MSLHTAFCTCELHHGGHVYSRNYKPYPFNGVVATPSTPVSLRLSSLCSLSLVRSLMSAGAAGASRSSSGLSSGYASRVLRPVLARRDGEVLLPTAETVRGSGVRHFGVMDKIQDKMERRNVNQQGVARVRAEKHFGYQRIGWLID